MLVSRIIYLIAALVGLGGVLVLIKYGWPGFIIIIAAILIIGYGQVKADEVHEANLSDNVLPDIGAKFGRLLGASPTTLSFERDGTVYNAEIEFRMVRNRRETDFGIKFDMPPNGQKFAVQHSSVFAKYYPDCVEVASPVDIEGFELHSLEPEFLKTLIARTEIINELNLYPSGWGNRFRIMFDDGSFDLMWRIQGVSQSDDPGEIREKIERICETAIVFRDRLQSA